VFALHEGSPGKGEGPGAWRRESADARTWHLMGGADTERHPRRSESAMDLRSRPARKRKRACRYERRAANLDARLCSGQTTEGWRAREQRENRVLSVYGLSWLMGWPGNLAGSL